MRRGQSGDQQILDAAGVRAGLKIARGPAKRDFGVCQGGEARPSPEWAVKAEPTMADDKRPDALRVGGTFFSGTLGAVAKKGIGLCT